MTPERPSFDGRRSDEGMRDPALMGDRERRFRENAMRRETMLANIGSNQDAIERSQVALGRTRELTQIPAFPQYGPDGRIDLPGLNDHPIMQDPAAREVAAPIIESRFNRRRMSGFWRQVPRRYRENVPYEPVMPRESAVQGPPEPAHGKIRTRYNRSVGLYVEAYDRNTHQWVMTEVKQTAAEVRAHGEAWSRAYDLRQAQNRERDRIAIGNWHNYLKNPIGYVQQRDRARLRSEMAGMPFEFDSTSPLTLPEQWARNLSRPVGVSATVTTHSHEGNDVPHEDVNARMGDEQFFAQLISLTPEERIRRIRENGSLEHDKVVQLLYAGLPQDLKKQGSLDIRETHVSGISLDYIVTHRATGKEIARIVFFNTMKPIVHYKQEAISEIARSMPPTAERTPEALPRQPASLLAYKTLLRMPQSRRDIILPTMRDEIKTALINDCMRAGLDETLLNGKDIDMELMQTPEGLRLYLVDLTAGKMIASAMIDDKEMLKIEVKDAYVRVARKKEAPREDRRVPPTGGSGPVYYA